MQRVRTLRANVFVSTSYIWGTSSAVTATQSSGGNSGAYRSIALTVAAYSGIEYTELWSHAVYDPSTQGSVSSVAMSLDVTRAATNWPGATQVAERFEIMQAGTIYRYHVGKTEVAPPTWDSASIANAIPLFPSIHWVNGGPITFGFSGTVGAEDIPFTITGGYDNFFVQVTHSDTVTPEPGTLMLIAIGVLTVVGGNNGGRAGTRTPDLLRVKQAL